MKIRATLKSLTILSLPLLFFGFYTSKGKAPRDFGFARAHIEDEALLELEVDGLRQRLRHGQIQLIDAAILSENSQARTSDKLMRLKQSDISDLSNARFRSMIELEGPQTTIINEKNALVNCNLGLPGLNKRESIELKFYKQNNRWKLVNGAQLLHRVSAMTATGAGTTDSFWVDAYELYHSNDEQDVTLEAREVSEELGITKITQAVTRNKLNRRLFQNPYAGVLFSSVALLENAPFVTARYVQLVTDPGWNRIVYGDYDGWIKAYGQKGEGPEDLNRPHGIDRDANGFVYVADTGNNRIVVLRLEGNGAGTQLSYQFSFGSGQLNLPYDVAWDDSGTPFEASDDVIWVADTGNDRLVGYVVNGKAASVRFVYGTRGKAAGFFFQPKAVSVARFDGLSDGQIYVADTGNRRLVKLAVAGENLSWMTAYTGGEESQFTSLDVDHWGNVYSTDRSYQQVMKLSANLEPITLLQREPGDLLGPINFSVVFGRVYTEADGSERWAGYDQAFCIEKWSDVSGAARFHLGLALQDFEVNLSQDLGTLQSNIKVTDQARLNLTVLDSQGNTVRKIPVGWVEPGEKSITWDRGNDSRIQIAPGTYQVQLSAESSYGSGSILKETEPFYLPMYYHEDSGSNQAEDAHLVQGVRSRDWGSDPTQSVDKHPSEVIYRFTGLNPDLDYEVKGEFYHEVDYLKQRMVIDDTQVIAEFEVPQGLKTVEWTVLPRETYSDGEITVGIQKLAGDGDAVVSQLWLREANYDPGNPPVLQSEDERIPETFSLSQNYPNPFNPSTTIRFAVPGNVSGNTRLTIFNMLGQKIKVLVNEQLSPGSHAIVWDGRDRSNNVTSSGVYFYELRAGDFVQVKKMALVK